MGTIFIRSVLYQPILIYQYEWWDDERSDAAYHYYRLRQLDLEGTSSFSSTIQVKMEVNPQNDAFLIFPNPAQTEVNVQVGFSESRLKSVKLLNASGNVVNEVKAIGELKTIRMVLGTLPAGLYFIQMESNKGELVSEKLMIH